LIKSEVVLPKKEKLVVNYPDYAFAHPIRLHPSCWVDDGDHLAGVHPKSSLPFLSTLLAQSFVAFAQEKIVLKRYKKSSKKSGFQLPMMYY
jgi:hypothetical protein